MKKQFLSALCLLLLPAFLLSGCWQADSAEPDEPNQITELIPEKETASTPAAPLLPKQFSLAYMPDQSLDPVTCPDGMQQTVASLLYEGLFRLGPDLEPEYSLCESYTCDEAFLTYTFTLRSGILFSDGSPLTAADVKASLVRAKTSARYGSRLANIRSVSAGENSVTVTLSSPNSALPALLDIPVVKSGTETLTAPIGTGPYFFSPENTAPCLAVNQLWWRGSGQPLDRISLVEAADRSTMLYRFTSRDVQLAAADLTGPEAYNLSGSISYQDANTTVLQYLGCNITRAPMNKAAFRYALNCGINREHIVSAFLSGHGLAAQFPLSPVSSLYPHQLEQPYSLDTFTAALAQSEYFLEGPLTLLVNAENSFKVSIAEYLAESFTDAGIPVEVRALAWEEYAAALAAGNFDLYYGEVRLSADWDLSALLEDGGAVNFGGWVSTQTASLLDTYAAAADREEAMEAICVHLQKFAPILPICFKSSSVLLQADVVDGLISTAAEPFYNLQSCTVSLQNSTK